jgi:predicted dehydrogenase
VGGNGHTSPSGKTTLAIIGCGGQGHINLQHFLPMKDVQVVAVCDVERETGGYISTVWERGEVKKVCGREPARKMVNAHYAKDRGVGHFNGCRAYVDYRELLDNEDVDAVLVATPDHTHAVICMAALKKRRHLFCEKPLAYSLHEARALVDAARDAGVATQLGNHGQADERARITQEYILDGAIGNVREVHVVVGKRWWAPPVGPPVEKPPVPKGLDWDLWLGPAPELPYHPDYHPWNWRDYRAFGTSELGDIGCHRLSTVFKALKLEHPISAEGECERVHPDIYPRKFKVKFEFPQRGDLPPVTLIWFDEGYDAPRPKDLEEKRTFKQGNVYYGDEGTLLNHMLVPQAKLKAYGLPPKVLPRSPGHHREWIEACRGGPPAGSDIVKHAGLLTETPLLGNIALTTDKKLLWDGPNLKITNDKTANAQVHRKYRDGWTL